MGWSKMAQPFAALGSQLIQWSCADAHPAEAQVWTVS